MAIIETNALTRRYGSRRGVESLSLSIPEGSLYGFLGPNGAGKTTAIRVLLGFLAPTDGTARVFGLDCWRQSRAIKADVGYVPGDLRLQSWLTGRKALDLFGKVRRRDISRHGRELAEELELDLTVKVRQMSRGMRQKLGLILALAHQPRLLILDEPTSALDPLMQVKFHRRLRKLAEAGHTVFFSSHSLAEVEQLCDRVAIIRDGKLVAQESLHDLRQRIGKQVVIRWNGSTAPPTDAPGFLDFRERNATVWTGMLTGSVDELVAWLGRYSVADLTIGHPDLETVFHEYYRQPDEAT